MADVAVVEGETICPAHSHMLAAFSSGFAEMLAAQDGQSGLIRLNGRVYTIPLADGELQSMRSALQMAYSLCGGQPSTVNIGSLQEAQDLARFGRKYGVKQLLENVDSYFVVVLSREHSYSNLKHNGVLFTSCVHCSRREPMPSSRYGPKHTVQDGFPKILEYTKFAESHQLPKALDHCQRWLAAHFTLLPAVYPQLFELQ